jgi:hypothetical protein
MTGYDGKTYPFTGKSFNEVVNLVDGTAIAARRDVVPGRAIYGPMGGKSYAPVYRLTLPDGIVWQSEEIITVAVDRDSRSWIVVGVPERDFAKAFGCAAPSYLYYRSIGERWQRVVPNDVPDRFNLNLVTRLHRMQIDDGQTVTLDQREGGRLKAVEGFRQISRAIWPDGKGAPKPEWSSPELYLDKFSKTCDPNTQQCVSSCK